MHVDRWQSKRRLMVMNKPMSDYRLSIYDKCVAILFGFVASIFYIRYLGVDLKGEYSFINEWINILGLILNLGIYQSYIYFYRKEGASIYSQYVVFFLIQFLVLLLLSTAIVVHGCTNTVALVCVELPFYILKLQYDNLVLIDKIKLYYVLNIFANISKAVLYAVFWAFLPVNLWFMILSVVGLNSLTCLAYLLRDMPRLKGAKPSFAFLKKALRFGWLPMLSSLLLTMNYSLDILLMKYLGTEIELGLYSLAATIIAYVWMIPNAFKEVLASRIAEKGDSDLVGFSIRIANLLTFIVFVVYLVIGGPAIEFLFGADFKGAYGVLVVLFIGAFSMIIFKMLGTVYLAEGRRKSYFLFLLISVLANFFLNCVLIPVFGMYGAAWSSVVSYSFCGILFLVFYLKRERITLISVLKPRIEDVQQLKRLFLQ